MYRKILVPLDRSPESEGVLPLVGELLEPDGELILLNIVDPAKTQEKPMDYLGQVAGQQGDLLSRCRAARHWARTPLARGSLSPMDYLGQVACQLGDLANRSRCEVLRSDRVAEGIAAFAVREKADLVLMFTHDRKGLAKMVRGSIAEKVQQLAPTEVRTVKPKELVPA